jgi:type IV pilus assembly protein PilB
MSVIAKDLATDLDAFLVDRLLRAGISEAQIHSVQSFHGEVEGRQPMSRTLVELGLATDEEMAMWIAEFHGWKYLPREQLVVQGEAFRALPEAIARNRHALVVRREASQLTVAVADPSAPQFAQVKYALEGNSIEWVISPQADIAAQIAQAYSPKVEIHDNELERFVEDMLREAAHTRGLSDIHCIPDDRCCDIRWRVDGDLVPWRTLKGSVKDAVCAQIKLSSTRGADGRSRGASASGGLDVANRLDAQDASSTREYGSKRVSFRYSRVLDQGAQVGSLEDLGMLVDTAMNFRGALKKANGIVLVSGPTGHGKSTTLAAAVPWLDSRNKRVLSIEDPVEYRLRTVTQSTVTQRLPFGAALRAFLRHNPDIIIVGEIRDSETAALAIRLALTGHLILSTVHANTAVQSIARLLDLGVEASLISATCRFLIGQRLVKRLCRKCRKPHRSDGILLDQYAGLLKTARCAGFPGESKEETHGFFEAGGGCGACNRTGFAGRIGIFEFRHLRSSVASQLAEQRDRFDSRTAELAFSQSFSEGDLDARNLRQDGILKAALGLITPEEVFGATMNGPEAD